MLETTRTTTSPEAVARPQRGRGLRTRRARVAGGLSAALFAAYLLVAPPATPCGPYLPTRLLLQDEEAALLSMPHADFGREVRALLPADDPAFAAVMPEGPESPGQQSARIGRADLAAALDAAGVAEPQREALLAEYDDIRAALALLAQRNRWPGEEDADIPLPDPPAAFPREFRLYLEGLSAYHLSEPKVADRLFRELLELPEAQRRRRSVWAAYMLGKVHLQSDPAAAARWFKRTRTLARAGFPDPLGLASSSLGWEGRAHLSAGRYDAAMSAYLRQWPTGDSTALISLHTATHHAVVHGQEPLVRAAADPTLQRVVTAFLLAKHWRNWNVGRYPDDAPGNWLEAVEAVEAATRANGDGEDGEAAEIPGVPGADRLAWLAYQANQLDDARWWLGQAGDTPIALWVRAKFALRDGDIDAGVRLLARASKGFPAKDEWHAAHPHLRGYEPVVPANLIGGELAVLKLGSSQYTDAMALLMKHGYTDAVYYIAEHVLSMDELKAFVASDRYAPRPSVDVEGLLANRLTRAGRWQEAKAYLDEAHQAKLMEYVNAIRAGHDKTKSAEARAEHLWLAATLAMTEVHYLLRFYAEPPHHVEKRHWWDARYAQNRPAMEAADQPRAITLVSDDELERLGAHADEFARDLHIPFIAAGHAWSACALMPDQDDRTAYRLTIAGNWIMYRDPDAADRFYKALATRCSQTELGKQAVDKKWFPKLTDDPLYLTK